MSDGRMPVVKHPRVERVLRSNGFEWVGGRGAHRVYQRRERRVVVPGHAGRDIPPGTPGAIIKAAGKSRGEFA